MVAREHIYGDVQDDDRDLLAVDVEIGSALCRCARDEPDECGEDEGAEEHRPEYEDEEELREASELDIGS